MADRSARDCIAEIEAAAGGRLSDDQVDQIVERLQRARQKRRADADLTSATTAGIEEAKRIGDEAALAALIEKRSRTINVLRKHQRGDFVNSLGPGREVDALRAMNVGSPKGDKGIARSVDAERLGLFAKLLGPMVAELRKGGLIPLFRSRSKEFQRDVARELWRLGDDTQPGTGNAFAEKTAKIVHKYQEMARLLQNDAGAWIGKVPGYIVRQSHDAYKIARAGFQEWRNNILPKLDERTFDDVADREKFLIGVYQGLSTGVHMKAGGGDWLGGFKGPGNLAKRVSQERVLHFKSADDWLAYNERFGSGDVLGSVVMGLNSAARNTAVMRTWGTNPEAAFTADLDQLKGRLAERAATGDKRAAKQLKKLGGEQVRAEFDQVTGAANIPGSITGATWSQTVRNIQNIKLGGAVISSITDVAAKAATMRHNGINFLEGIGNGLRDTLGNLGDAERREAADLIGVGLDALIGGTAARFSAADGVPGAMTKLQDIYFKLNLLTPWTDAHHSGAGLMLARNLARNANKDFERLNPDLQRSLARYGIGVAQWELIRRAASEVEGKRFLTPDMLDRLPDDLIALYAGKTDEASIRRARTDLELGLRSYLSETANEAMTIAGARERAMMTRGARPGTAWGEAARFFWQFKTFSVTFLKRHVAREIQRKGKVDVPGLVQMVVWSTALGYVAMAAKDIAKGRTPRDPNDPATWAAAFQQGGGAGIYGDFLMGRASRFGQGPLDTFMGPTYGMAGKLLDMYYATRDGEDPSAQGLKMFIDNMPNLFYARAALDYLVMYQVGEMMNPGYLKRMEKRIKKENNQSFFIPPSTTMPRGGGPRILEGVR